MTDAAAIREEALLQEVVARLVEVFRPERIYLFGSRARGDRHEDSDYDLMVIVPSSDLPPHQRETQAYLALWGILSPTDILVWTREEFERYLPVVGSLAATVVREGRLLYAA